MVATRFASKFPHNPDTCVRLNVGGVEHVALVKTLTSKSRYFKKLARQGGPDVPMVSESGSFFIDRDGVLFGVLLAYMRTGEFAESDKIRFNLVFLFYEVNVNVCIHTRPVHHNAHMPMSAPAQANVHC
jgi:hypothetical protein